jgi:hypothetical protein
MNRSLWIFTAVLVLLGLWLLEQTCTRRHPRSGTTQSSDKAAQSYSTSSGETGRLSPAPAHRM